MNATSPAPAAAINRTSSEPGRPEGPNSTSPANAAPRNRTVPGPTRQKAMNATSPANGTPKNRTASEPSRPEEKSPPKIGVPRNRTSEEPAPPRKTEMELDKELMELAAGAADRTTQAAVDALLSDGADPDACCTEFGGHALHAAAINDNAVVAAALLDAGADPGVTDERFGDTPLHDAAVHNAVKLARLLIGAGAEIDPLDDNGETPLHHAAEWGSAEVAGLLVREGADVGVETPDGLTPADLICEALCLPGANETLRELLVEESDEEMPTDEAAAPVTAEERKTASEELLQLANSAEDRGTADAVADALSRGRVVWMKCRKSFHGV
eukprot:evm.model.scf_543EXC.6 EVM.evm.TU.scf_543EXC.6   scf_543EXC:49677-54725(+)